MTVSHPFARRPFVASFRSSHCRGRGVRGHPDLGSAARRRLPLRRMPATAVERSSHHLPPRCRLNVLAAVDNQRVVGHFPRAELELLAFELEPPRDETVALSRLMRLPSAWRSGALAALTVLGLVHGSESSPLRLIHYDAQPELEEPDPAVRDALDELRAPARTGPDRRKRRRPLHQAVDLFSRGAVSRHLRARRSTCHHHHDRAAIE